MATKTLKKSEFQSYIMLEALKQINESEKKNAEGKSYTSKGLPTDVDMNAQVKITNNDGTPEKKTTTHDFPDVVKNIDKTVESGEVEMKQNDKEKGNVAEPGHSLVGVSGAGAKTVGGAAKNESKTATDKTTESAPFINATDNEKIRSEMEKLDKEGDTQTNHAFVKAGAEEKSGFKTGGHKPEYSTPKKENEKETYSMGKGSEAIQLPENFEIPATFENKKALLEFIDNSAKTIVSEGWPKHLKKGRFTTWCKKNGFPDGPSKSAAEKAMKSDDASVRGMASFYLNTDKPEEE